MKKLLNKIELIWDNIIYWPQRKYRQIKKLIRYTPLIWNSFDFDYRYAIDLFSLQLTDIADMLESDKAMTLTANQRGKRLRMILKLMKKVYDEDYALEYQDKVESKYGKHTIEFESLSNKIGYSEMISYYGGKKETPEIRSYVSKELRKSSTRQNRAHKLLWELLEHNIQGWWD